MPIFNNNDIEIAINGTGLLVNSASINISPSLDEIRAIGGRAFSDFSVDGGFTSQISLSYTPEVTSEPNFAIATGSLNPTTFADRNFQIAFAGITGDYYLDSYQFSVNNLNQAQATVSYTCYHQLSGDFQSSSHVSFDTYNLSGIAHSWSTYAEKQNGDDVNVLSFNYSYQNTHQPFYRIGSPYPHQVMSMGIVETYDIDRDVYSNLSYSGSTVSQMHDDLYKFRCASVSGLVTAQDPQDLTFTIDGGVVNSQTITTENDSSPIIQTTIIKIHD